MAKKDKRPVRTPPRPPGIFGLAFDRLRDRGKKIDEETDKATVGNRRRK